MASLPITGLETHPTGTLNVGGIINDNWETLENIFDPAHVGAQAGVLAAALAGMTTITYGASINVDMAASRPLNLVVLAGALTIACTNKGIGRVRRLIIVGDGTDRAITVPVGAVWAGPALATVLAGTTVVLTIYSRTTADSGLVLTANQAPTYAALGIVPKIYGGTGADNSAVTFPGTGTLATTDDVAAAVNGLAWKASARAKTTANVNLASGGIANGVTIDGVTLATGDRVLVAAQTLPEENGIYIAPASGAASRAADANTAAEILHAAIYVQEGSTGADVQYHCTTNAPIVLGTTGLVWVAIAAGVAYLAGTGLQLTGVTFSIDSTVATLTGSQTLVNKTLTAPKVDSILDANGNELVIFTTTTSAVNEITWANAATGGKPTLTASGGDTNITLQLLGKGTGGVEILKAYLTAATSKLHADAYVELTSSRAATDADNGKVLWSTAAYTITFPDSLTKPFTCGLKTEGAFKITTAVSGTAVLVNIDGHTGTAAAKGAFATIDYRTGNDVYLAGRTS